MINQLISCQPGVVLFTALLSKAQSLIRAPPPDPVNLHSGTHPDQIELEHFPRQFSVFLDALLPSLPDLFPSSIAAKHAFGPSAYLMSGEKLPEKEGIEMERREAEVWGLAAAFGRQFSGRGADSIGCCFEGENSSYCPECQKPYG